jgi:hypothetical protein
MVEMVLLEVSGIWQGNPKATLLLPEGTIFPRPMIGSIYEGMADRSFGDE